MMAEWLDIVDVVRVPALDSKQRFNASRRVSQTLGIEAWLEMSFIRLRETNKHTCKQTNEAQRGVPRKNVPTRQEVQSANQTIIEHPRQRRQIVMRLGMELRFGLCCPLPAPEEFHQQPYHVCLSKKHETRTYAKANCVTYVL